MRLDLSVPKINAEAGADGGGGPMLSLDKKPSFEVIPSPDSQPWEAKLSSDLRACERKLSPDMQSREAKLSFDPRSCERKSFLDARSRKGKSFSDPRSCEQKTLSDLLSCGPQLPAEPKLCEPQLSSVRDGTEAFLAHTAGKALILADSVTFSALLPAARLSRAVTVVFDGDALSLFALPEVGCVLACGGAQTMRAARYFAGVRRIPCMLFPADSTFDGVYEARAKLDLSDKKTDVALADAQVLCDLSLLKNTFAEGYARLVLSRLALFEAKAAGLIDRRPFGGTVYEEAFSLLDAIRGELSGEEVALKNARMRILERSGAPVGEGIALAALYDGMPLPALLAERTLSALYFAFFRRGTPRRYCIADYRTRAERAGIAYGALHVPDESTYAARALTLERVRGELLAEITRLRSAHAAQLRAVRVFSACEVPVPDLKKLQTLPELAPQGLCALMRDFGLLENI